VNVTRTNSRPYALAQPDDEPDERDRDPDDAPETPLDEPRPPRVEDPPPEPGDKGPYVVRDVGRTATH
jgi:hypothetical protein